MSSSSAFSRRGFLTATARTAEGSNTAADGIYNFFGSGQAQVYNAGYPDVTTAFQAWNADAAKHAYKPLFWNLNITVPDQFSKAAAQAELWDATQAVAHGKQPGRLSLPAEALHQGHADRRHQGLNPLRRRSCERNDRCHRSARPPAAVFSSAATTTPNNGRAKSGTRTSG